LPVVKIRGRAQRDIVETADYLEMRGDVEAALRFLEAAQITFWELAAMPRAGAECDFRQTPTRRLRRWQVKGFEEWLIFYLPKRHGVEIVRVVRGARDLERVLR
jgi:toxin ParE1/3/4